MAGCAAAANRRCPRCTPLQRVLALVVSCWLALYGYLWRHYFAIVLAPPSTSYYRHRVHYKQTYASLDSAQVVSLRKELTQSLPEWIVQYVHWHASVRASGLNESTPILLVSIGGHHVGGLADRLRSLPFLLWEAIRTNRIFLMEWTNPCALEEFLLPPLGGIDWVVPESLRSVSDAVWYDYDEHDNKQLADNDSFRNTTVIKIRHSPWTFDSGVRLLADTLNITSWSDPVFAHIFQLLLTPSPPVQQLLDDTMQRLGLSYQQYDAVHLRARYPGTSDAFQPKATLFSRSVDADGFQWTPEAKTEVVRLVKRAIACVPKPTNGTLLPVYFASDTNEAVKLVTSVEENVVGMVTSYERLHLNRNDRIGLIRKTPPSAFYPTIVDLWLLSQARCLSIGAGGYGVVASMIGETDCVVYHQHNSFVGTDASYCTEET